MATENALFWHCSQHVFERHRQTSSREISFSFFFNLFSSCQLSEPFNNSKMKFHFWIKLFSHVCVIASVRISNWSGIKQIGEATNILFSLSFFKKKQLLQLEVKCEHVTSLNFYVYARPSIHCLYFVTSVKFTFVHVGLIPVSRNFYVRKFICVNEIEAMHERSRVNVKVEPRSTFTLTRDRPYIASILFMRVKFTGVRA